MRFLAASLLATALLASTACSDDPSPADDDSDDDVSSSSSSSSGRGGSSSGRSSTSSSSSSSSGRPSSSSGSTTSSSSGGSSGGSSGSTSSSSGSSSGEPWPGPSGTPIAAGVVPNVADLEQDTSAHLVATGADDGSFAVLFYAWPAFPEIGGAYVEKHEADGTLVWRKRLEFTPTSPFSGLTMDADGNVYAAVNASPAAGLTIDATDIPNLRVAETPDIGECVIVRLASADGAKGWHGHVTLRTGLALAGNVDVQCRGLAVRDNQVVASGVYPTRDIFYVHNGVSTSASGTQSDTTGDQAQSFVLSLAADTGVKNNVSTLVHTGSGEFAVDGIALGTDGRTLLHAFAQGNSVKVGTAGSGDLLYTPPAQSDVRFNPMAALNLTAAVAAGRLEAADTLASPNDPETVFPQVVALPGGAGLFGVSLYANNATSFRPPNGGTAAALVQNHAYFMLTQWAGDASGGQVRALDLGDAENFPQNYLASGADGSVVLAGFHDAPLAFGAGCDTAAVGPAGAYLVSFGTTPLAGCKFAIPLPAGVLPSRVAVAADGRIVLAGLYTQALTFVAGVTLPAPAGGIAPFYATFVP